MANKDLFKQAIAEAKSVREAAIANAKEALEETLTPHLKDMLAAKLQEQEEIEESQIEDTVVNEVEEEVEEVIEEESSEEVQEELSEEVYASKDEISELKAMIEDLKNQLQLKEEEKVEEIGLAVTTMLSEQEQLEEELSKPASEPIKHSPEAKQELNKVVYSQKRNLTTKDIVYNKIANFK